MSDKGSEQTLMDLSSMGISEEKMKDFLACFPEAQTEGGQIDFDQLKRALGERVEAGKERYGLTWPGKADCFKTIQAPSMGTLRPMRDESVNFDDARNVIIEGDNLEVLKLMQKAYLGKVKMIYIDPPYNTGKDFIYPDNYTETLQTYLEFTGQVDAEGKKFGSNLETDGRFHSKWLNMIYPRLYLARNILAADGVILVSIDDNEMANLRGVLNDIFGEENFLATLVWEKGRKNDARFVSVGHEYMVLYAKNKTFLTETKTVWREVKPGAAEIQAKYLQLRDSFADDNDAVEKGLREFYAGLPKSHPSKAHSRYNKVDSRGVWRDDNLSWPGGGGPEYDVEHPKTGKPCAVPEGGWRYSSPERMQEMIDQGVVVFRDDHTEPPIRKTYLIRTTQSDDPGELEDSEGDEGLGLQVAGSYFYRSAIQATNETVRLFGAKVFDNPKDHEILARWIRYICTDPESIVVDFFAGSGTTAQAVLQANNEDGKRRRFVLVQLPELLEAKSKSGKAAIDYCLKSGLDPVLSSLTRERIRKVLEDQSGTEQATLDGDTTNHGREGYRAFALTDSCFERWDGDVKGDAKELQSRLQGHVSHVKRSRSAEDVFFEVLLKSGFQLDTPVKQRKIAGVKVFDVGEGGLVLCLESKLTMDAIKAIAAEKPVRAVFLDEAFMDNDQLKVNAVQTFKAVKPDGEKNDISMFQTV